MFAGSIIANGSIIASDFNGSTKYMCHNGVPSNVHTFKPCGVEGKKKKKAKMTEGKERGEGTRGERREIKVLFYLQVGFWFLQLLRVLAGGLS